MAINPSFNILFENLPVPAVLMDFETKKIIEANPCFSERFVKKGVNPVGMTTLELEIWPDPEERQKIIDKLVSGQSIVNEKTKLIDSSGRECFFILNMSNADGVLIGTAFDITEIEEKNKELEKQKIAHQKLLNKYQKIISLTGTAYVILDEDLVIQESNETMGEILLLDPVDIIGEKFLYLLEDIENAREKTGDKMLKMLKDTGHSTISEEVCLKKKDGTLQWVSLNAGTFGYNKIVCFMNNISEKKQKEQSRFIDSEKTKDKIKQRLLRFQKEVRAISSGKTTGEQ